MNGDNPIWPPVETPEKLLRETGPVGTPAPDRTAELRADLARVTAKRDALRRTVEDAHCEGVIAGLAQAQAIAREVESENRYNANDGRASTWAVRADERADAAEYVADRIGWAIKALTEKGGGA